VISPLVEDIAGRNFQKIGVIATKATIRSDVYARSLHELRPEMEVYSLATSLLAQMIEEGFFNNQISRTVLHQYLSYPDFEDIQALLLACTHYPIVRPEIEAYFGERVQVFDSVDTVVARVRSILEAKNLLNEQPNSGQAQFYVSDYTHSFQQTAEIFYKKYTPLHLLRWQGERLERV
jgi:glutamate racemase